METLEDRAIRVADKVEEIVNSSDKRLFRDLIAASYMRGALDEREEFMRWRDPREALPDYYHAVLVKYLKDGLYRYAVAWLSVNDDDEYSWVIDETSAVIRHRNVHFWRPIIEAKKI